MGTNAEHPHKIISTRKPKRNRVGDEKIKKLWQQLH
jgi:hypothetical protein